MADVFLSYSRKDQPVARRFAQGLGSEGFSVWWDDAINPGEAFDQVTERALREAGATVVLWSPQSVSSRWVRSEATLADRLGTLVPVTIETCERPIVFELTHTADLAGWSGDTADPRWRSFIERLSRMLQRPAAAAIPAASPNAAASPAAGKPAPRRAAWLGAALAALALAAAAAWWFLDRPPARTASRDASIAVLPFRDMSQSKDQEYLADGIAEEILNSLAGIEGLKVTARTSAFAFKGKDTDVREIGSALGVRHVLEGSVRKDGDQLRITTQLIDTESDARLWSRSYDRPLQDIFAIQDDIAKRVAETLQVSLGVGIGQRPGMTRNAEAFEAYLGAIEALNSYQPLLVRRGVALAEEAVRLDPDFGLAWLLLLDGYDVLPAMGAKDTEDWSAKREVASREVQRLAPDLPQGEMKLGARSVEQGRWKDASAHYRKASEIAARLGMTGTLNSADGYPPFLIQVGRSREAIPILERARVLDPLNVWISVYLIAAYGAAGNARSAFEVAEQAEGFNADSHSLVRGAAVAVALGTRDPSTIDHWVRRQLQDSADPLVRDFMDGMAARLEDPEGARAFLADARSSIPPSGLAITAQWESYFGDPAGALEKLRSASRPGARAPAALLLWLPVHQKMRELPEFKDLVREMGLVEYWKESGWPEDYCKPTGGEDFECR